MSVGLSPIQLIVLSGLLQDRGLRLPPTLTSRIDSLKDTGTIFGKLSYIAYHPKTVSTYASILTALKTVPGLSGVVPTDYTATLPVGVRQRDVVGSIRARADALLANGLKGLLDNVSVCSGVLSNSFGVQGSVNRWQDAKFSDFYLGATNYTDVITHGLSNTFGSSATGTPAALKAANQQRTVTATEISTNIKQFVAAIKKLGKLYDFTDLNSVGHASALVSNLYKQGVYNRTVIAALMKQYGYDVRTITTDDDLGLTQLLQQVTGNDLTTIVKATGAQIPTGSTIASAADFLDAKKVLPVDVSEMLPKQDLTQLGKKLTSLGVKSNNIDTILTQLDAVEVIDVQYLDKLSQPLPKADVAVIQSQLVNGNGHFNNATLDNLLGVLTGSYDASLDVLIRANTEFAKNPLATALQTAASAVVAKLSTSQTVDPAEITALNTAIANIANLTQADAQKQNILSFYTQVQNSKTAIVSILDQLKLELENGRLAGLPLNPNIEVFATPTLIDTFNISTVQSARYFITVQNGTSLDVTENLIVQNGTTANVVTYGRSSIGTDYLGSLTASINTVAGTCEVYYTARDSNDTHYFLKQKADYVPTHEGADANVLQGSIAEISVVQRLDEIAVDTQYTRIGTLLETMASNDVYGQAILASMSIARNAKNLAPIGVTTPKADPQDQLRQTLSQQGLGLTEDQKKAITARALETGVDPQLAISNASKFGFFNSFYSR